MDRVHTVRIANAPVSLGVYSLEDAATGPSPDRVLAEFAAQGYAGVDLGPLGYFGRGAELDARLQEVEFGIAGGWIDLPFFDDQGFQAGLDGYRDVLRVMRDAYRPAGAPAPKPTLACSGTPDRAARPGGGPDVRLSAAGWSRMAANIATAVSIAQDEGLEPTFHHHACTYVETVDEIDELLDRTEIGLTFDTGHLILGGGDPVADLGRWMPRVNHFHLKDARLQVLRDVLAAGGGTDEVWAAGAFTRLGAGDLDIAAILGLVEEHQYSGWIVVEQDVVPRTPQQSQQMWDDQRENRAVLRRWFA